MGFLFFKRRHHKDTLIRKVVKDSASRPWYYSPIAVLRLLLLAALVTVLALICFWGRPAHLPILLPDTDPKVRYDAQFDFTYTSSIQTKKLKELARHGVEPAFHIVREKNPAAIAPYRKFISKFDEKFDELKSLPAAEQKKRYEKLFAEAALPGVPGVMSSALERLVQAVPEKTTLLTALDESLAVLGAVLDKGVYSPQPDISAQTRTTPVPDTFSLSQAVRHLRDNFDLIAARAKHEAHAGVRERLLEFFRPGLISNVELDENTTAIREAKAIEAIADVVVAVEKGDPLLQPGERVGDRVLERWNAYREKMSDSERLWQNPLHALEDNATAAIAVMLLFALFVRVCPLARLRRRSVTLAIFAVVVNLLIIRGFLEVGEWPSVTRMFGSAEVFFWLAPPALGAIVTAILSGMRLALIVGFFVSFFATLMLGRSVDVFLVLALASLAGIYCCRRVRARGDVFRAGLWVGITMAVAVLFVCLVGKSSWSILAWQVAGCLVSGLATGALTLVILPALEKIFKITSDITLLELSDFNTPLLRKLPIVAPGTFNHSANVANLAASAADAIGANALLCRCASLYHDIGKMAKPEYFVENQGTVNPHDKVTPNMSSIIIRGHVTNGVKIAREYSLPRELIDIIQQHHGTGIVRFFYDKAQKQAEAEGGEADESAFRYLGPRPLTRESTIIMIADGLEAASRAQKNPKPQTLRDLANGIIGDLIKNGQFEDSPITFHELSIVRENMVAFLLTMYHHRIEYPKGDTRTDERRTANAGKKESKH